MTSSVSKKIVAWLPQAFSFSHDTRVKIFLAKNEHGENDLRMQEIWTNER
jgi:hypothetical protein